jgi:hypothetical protein
MFEAVFSMRSVSRSYKLEKSRVYLVTRVEVGSNTPTVTLRIVGDEKESLKSKTVKYGREKDRPVLSSERAPHKNKIATVKE